MVLFQPPIILNYTEKFSLKEKINNPIIPRRGKIAISLYGFFIYSFLQILIKDVSILIDIDYEIKYLNSDYKKYNKY